MLIQLAFTLAGAVHPPPPADPVPVTPPRAGVAADTAVDADTAVFRAVLAFLRAERVGYRRFAVDPRPIRAEPGDEYRYPTPIGGPTARTTQARRAVLRSLEVPEVDITTVPRCAGGSAPPPPSADPSRPVVRPGCASPSTLHLAIGQLRPVPAQAGRSASSNGAAAPATYRVRVYQVGHVDTLGEEFQVDVLLAREAGAWVPRGQRLVGPIE